jgi:hypothetical protein
MGRLVRCYPIMPTMHSRLQSRTQLSSKGESMTFESPRFDGSDYVRARDDVRLKGQLLRVWDCMSDGKWRTLGEIARLTGDPESSVSAQLRHLRKERFGAHTVEKEYKDFGLFEYRLIKNDRA